MFVLGYITCADEEEAKKISHHLLNKKMVACANYFPINSVFEWKGEVQEEGEYLLLCKTTTQKFQELKKEVKEIHSYDSPAIIAFPMVDGDQEFLNWIEDSVQGTNNSNR